MNEYERFQQAFSVLHASGSTLQNVLSRVQSNRGAKGVSRQFAILVAVLIMLFSMTLIAHATGLLADIAATFTPAKDPDQVIANAFGDSISTQKPDIRDAYGNPVQMPQMTRPADQNAAANGYVSDLEGTVTLGENTFTLQSFLIDETGSGMVTWTVENPNGIAFGDAGYGAVYFAPMAPFYEPRLYHYSDGEKQSANLYNALVSQNEMGTKLEIVSYFGTYKEYREGDSFVLVFGSRQGAQSIQISPTKAIPAKTMAADTGMALTIANQSMTVAFRRTDEFVPEKVVIQFLDGSEYCLDDAAEKIHNTSGAFWRAADGFPYGELVYLFNRIIDTDQVASVTLEGHWLECIPTGDDYENIRHHETYTFLP